MKLVIMGSRQETELTEALAVELAKYGHEAVPARTSQEYALTPRLITHGEWVCLALLSNSSLEGLMFRTTCLRLYELAQEGSVWFVPVVAGNADQYKQQALPSGNVAVEISSTLLQCVDGRKMSAREILLAICAIIPIC